MFALRGLQNAVSGAVGAVASGVEAQIADDVKDKVGTLCSSKFDGDLRAAFDHYAGVTGKIDAKKMERILGDAGVSSMAASNDQIAAGCIKRFDPTGSGKVSWTQFKDSV